ncbi:MAG: dihydrolipoyl dehydrogenase [Promethearchaeota archaeon]
MDSFDLVVIGSGVGLNILNRALNIGLKCALVEEGKMGGTCLTRGCIPSKILVYPADLIREAQHAKKIGITFNVENIDWKLVANRMWHQIDESKMMDEQLSSVSNLTVYRGIGEFTGNYKMTVNSKDGKNLGSFKGERFVIASGGRSFVPPIEGLNDVGYITSESFFGDKFPETPWKNLIIIGGGIIAAEFAHIFSSFGTKIIIVEMLSRLVSTEEPEISTFLEQNFKKYMTVLVNNRAIKAHMERDLKVVTVKDTQSGEERELKAEEILVATGRRSNADILKVEKTGVETNKSGWIITNEFLETSKKNIWCIGDANGLYQFRHKANYEAQICINNIFDEKKQRVNYSSVPWAIFTYPQIGHVGMTEAEAIESGHEILVAIYNYSEVAKGYAMGINPNDIEDGFVKLIVDKSYQILGAHIVGPHAAILVQPFVYLMNAGFSCNFSEGIESDLLPKALRACPEGGTFIPIYNSMVIHPSLNEVTGWAIGSLRPINIKHEHHYHEH